MLATLVAKYTFTAFKASVGHLLYAWPTEFLLRKSATKRLTTMRSKDANVLTLT